MKWLRGRSIWDNPYFLHVATNARAKMKPESAIKALKLLQGDPTMPCAAFTDKICMPMKVLEVWCALMAKRFGSVCAGSAAFHRLVSSLETRAGLQSVLACAKASIMLHDTGGNPDCVLLVAEFTRCQAGGLPPPACLPLVTEEDKKKAAVEAKQKEEDAAAERARAHEESKSMELELFAMTNMQSTSVPGVSAGTEMASDTLAADMSRVHFQETVTQLIKASKGVVESSSRTTVVLDVASSSISVLKTFMDAVSNIWENYAQGAGSVAAARTRFRLVTLCGRGRHDLMFKVEQFVTEHWGHDWTSFCVHLRRKKTQSRRLRPSYAIVACPITEIGSGEPVAIDLSACVRGEEIRTQGIQSPNAR